MPGSFITIKIDISKEKGEENNSHSWSAGLGGRLRGGGSFNAGKQRGNSYNEHEGSIEHSTDNDEESRPGLLTLSISAYFPMSAKAMERRERKAARILLKKQQKRQAMCSRIVRASCCAAGSDDNNEDDEDSGKDISEHNEDDFFKFSLTDLKGGARNGLDLHLAKLITELHGGSIAVKSKVETKQIQTVAEERAIYTEKTVVVRLPLVNAGSRDLRNKKVPVQSSNKKEEGQQQLLASTLASRNQRQSSGHSSGKSSGGGVSDSYEDDDDNSSVGSIRSIKSIGSSIFGGGSGKKRSSSRHSGRADQQHKSTGLDEQVDMRESPSPHSSRQ